MEPIASFSGIASGVQWRDLIDQIMQVERRPATLLQRQITQVQTRSSAWLSFQNKLTGFQGAAEKLADGSAFESFSTSVSGDGFKAGASADAAPGSYSVEVLRTATAEKLGGDIVASASDALGHAGELWLNGSRIEVGAGDSLTDIAYTINAANTGTSATGVSAAVVSAGEGYQLVLTSQRTGAAGIDLAGGDGLLGALGFTDGTTALKHVTSDGGRSDAFASATTAISDLLGLTGTRTGRVTLGSGAGEFQVDLDLGAGLDAMAAAIDAAATATGSGVRAEVVAGTVDGRTVHRLDISGTTTFADANGVLETLGVLEGGRGAVAQQLRSGVPLEAGGVTATGATLLTDLDSAGAPAGSQPGDTFTVTGTRRDGTAFALDLEITDGASPASRPGYTGVATLDDVVAALSSADGYDGSATAAVVDGRLVVTDATGGGSQLGLSIVTHNEAGGTLDFGAIETATVGRAREIVDGTDAAVRIDGVYSTHETNSVSGAIPGVSLTLTEETSAPGVVTVSRDVDAVVDAVKGLVDGYNGIASFVNDQFTGGEGSNKPLSGDSTLRGMQRRALEAMQETLTSGVGGDWSRLGDLGVEIQRDGTFELDQDALRDALTSDPMAVERLLGLHGSATGTGLRYLGASDDTVSGSYGVNVTAPATTASALGSTALGTTYDGLADTLELIDLGSGKSYSVDLAAGQTAAKLVDDLNTEFATVRTHAIASTTALASDVGGTPVTADTTWDTVHQVGADAGVANGDTLTISGRRTDGTSFMEKLVITDTATQTVGELRNRIRNAVGAGASVELGADGKFVVTADEAGSSLVELTISSDNAGGGTLALGTEVTTDGRPAADIVASLEGGALRLTHDGYGSSAGFRVQYDTGAAEAELGLGASGVEHRGTDVEGTIGGMAATGSGQVLTGGEDTDVDGLMIRVDAGFTAGEVLFSRGIASRVERAVSPFLGSDAGSIQSIIDGLDERVTSLNDRIDDIEVRIDRRREDLIRRFTAMEQAMAVAQNESAWLMSQIGALPGAYSSNSG